jgi:hypothetical protein
MVGQILPNNNKNATEIFPKNFCNLNTAQAELKQKAHTSCQRARTTPYCSFLSLCNKTMTAQSLPSKSCVGGTKRPMATGE